MHKKKKQSENTDSGQKFSRIPEHTPDLKQKEKSQYLFAAQ